MGSAVEELQRIGLKLFAVDGARARPRELVPVFHHWIQTQAIADQLLVDVADYSHVPEGPGVLLVAHEGNFSLDLGGGRMGLAYYRKAPAAGALAERLRLAMRSLLDAAVCIESDPSLDGRIRFRGDELELFANDRLRAPNLPETLKAFEPALETFLRGLYGTGGCTITPEADPRERFGVHVRAPNPVTPRDLLARLD